jgi:hypothetical protein
MFAPVSIVIGNVVLLNWASILSASGVQLNVFILCLVNAVIKGEQLSAVFNSAFGFLIY